MARKKRHHYIPKFLLDGFVDPNVRRHLWKYEKGNSTIESISTRDAAVRIGYYSVPVGPGVSDSEVFEDALGWIEDDAASILRRIQRRVSLTGDERNRFGYFLASMMMRTPISMDIMLQTWKMTPDRIMRLLESDREKFESLFNSLAEGTSREIALRLERLNQFVVEKPLYPTPNRAVELIGMLDAIMNFAPKLNDLKWTFLVAPKDQSFVTSDNPFYYEDPTRDPHCTTGAGFGSRNIEVTLPLSSGLAFLGTRRRIVPGYLYVCANVAREVNRRTVVSALRFVFASYKSRLLWKFVQKYADERPRVKLKVERRRDGTLLKLSSHTMPVRSLVSMLHE